MTGKVSDAGVSYIYTYNLQNRLSTPTITRTEGTSLVDITSAYVYNQSGIRVGSNTITKIDGGPADTKTTVYLTDPANFTGYSQVIKETVNGTLANSYTLGDDVLAQTANGTTSYLQYDGHGSTRLLTNASSAIASRFDYDAYGKSVGFVSNVTSPASTDMLYSGEQFDPNLQMQYLRARYYDQNAGVFNRLDLFNANMGDPQSLHKYAYAHCNPVMGIDPSGLFMRGLTGMVGTLAIRMAIYGMIGGTISGTIFSATGGNFFQGFLLGAVAGVSLTYAFTMGRGPISITLGFLQGFTNVVIEYLVAFSRDESASRNQHIQNFITGFAMGAANGAFAETKIGGPRLAAIISIVNDIIGNIGKKWNSNFLKVTLQNAITSYVIAYISGDIVNTHMKLGHGVIREELLGPVLSLNSLIIWQELLCLQQ